ncbi:MAG: hypothetical protein R3D88_04760 [Alphaproteobacteria bacterium]
MTYYTIKQINELHPGISIPTLRKRNFNKLTNGMNNIFKKLGETVLVHEERLVLFIDLENEKEIYGKITKEDLKRLNYSELEGNVIVKNNDLLRWMEDTISLKVREILVKKRHPR